MRVVLRKKPLLAFLIFVWFTIVIFSVLDGIGAFGLGNEANMYDIFLYSHIVRSMFVDVGILSLFCAAWIVWDGYVGQIGKTIALPFAVLTLFIGSQGLLLYLIIRVWMWKDEKWIVAEGALHESWGPFKVKKYK